jgi:hypothetical protein
MRRIFATLQVMLFVLLLFPACPTHAQTRAADPPPNGQGTQTASGQGNIPFAFTSAVDKSPYAMRLEIPSRVLSELGSFTNGLGFSTNLNKVQLKSGVTTLLNLLTSPPSSNPIVPYLKYLNGTEISALQVVAAKQPDDINNNDYAAVLNAISNILFRFQINTKYHDLSKLNTLALDGHFRHFTERVSNREVNIFTTSLLYSSLKSNFDAGIQFIDGDVHGIGASLRYAPPKFRHPDLLTLTRSNSTAGNSQLLKDYSRSQLGWRYAFFLNYSHIYGGGALWQPGVSVSYLLPQRGGINSNNYGESSSGWLFQASVQQSVVDLAGSRNGVYVPFRVGVAWQDEMPFPYETTEKDALNRDIKVGKIRRWHKRFGIDYGRDMRFSRLPSGAPDFNGFGNSWALTARFRDHGSGEYTLIGGKTANGDDFWGITVGSFIKWD